MVSPTKRGVLRPQVHLHMLEEVMVLAEITKNMSLKEKSDFNYKSMVSRSRMNRGATDFTMQTEVKYLSDSSDDHRFSCYKIAKT